MKIIGNVIGGIGGAANGFKKFIESIPDRLNDNSNENDPVGVGISLPLLLSRLPDHANEAIANLGRNIVRLGNGKGGGGSGDVLMNEGKMMGSSAEDRMISLDGDDDGATTTTTTTYIALFVVLVFFWPAILSVFVAFTSASTWMFWLLTSALFGLLQFVYATYQFIMITIDLLALSSLKTFATMRSWARFYTIKSGLSRDDPRKGRRRGRRRAWVKKLCEAKNFEEFCKIEVEDPLPEVHGEKNGVGRQSFLSFFFQRPWRIRQDDTHKVKHGATGSLQSKKISPRNLQNDHHHNQHKNIQKGQNSMKRIRQQRGAIKSNAASTANSNDIRRASSYNQLPSNSPTKSPRNPTPNTSRNNSISVPLTTSSPRSLGSSGRVQSFSNINRFSAALRGEADSDREDNRNNADDWGKPTKAEEELGMRGGMLLATTARLRELRLQATAEASKPPLPPSASSSTGNHENDGLSSLKFLLAGVVKRNHLNVDDALVEDGRVVAESGRHSLSSEARDVIYDHLQEVETCLNWIADSPLNVAAIGGSDVGKTKETTDRSNPLSSSTSSSSQSIPPSATPLSTPPPQPQPQPPTSISTQEEDPTITTTHLMTSELSDRISLLRRLKQNTGKTALMLSGGGAVAMNHLGTVKMLIESGLYKDISVFSGTSGGSIAVAMVALKTPEELLRDVCVKEVSTDYLLNGEMKKQNIRWFPPVWEMVPHWLKTGLLVKTADFKKCCDFYYGDTTFEEAFERTGKHVCITVSASRSGGGQGGKGAQRLLLNHISTPHVTLSSAVATSCALPGVMAPRKLMAKNNRGEQVPFEVDGVEWIDGSVQADLPFQRISTLFNVSNYIVVQVNFHVVPFLNKAHHPGVRSLYWRAFQTCEWDMRNRALNLSRLGLFPKLFGQDFSKLFKQKYTGNLTLVPRFTTMQTLGLKALVNPTVQDMEIYLQNGQIAGWPYTKVIREMLRLEIAIEKCISRLEERYCALSPSNTTSFRHGPGGGESETGGDGDSIMSAQTSAIQRARLLGVSREAELLRFKVQTLERDNLSLRKQVEQLQRALGIVRPFEQQDDEEEEKKGVEPVEMRHGESTGVVVTDEENNNNEKMEETTPVKRQW